MTRTTTTDLAEWLGRHGLGQYAKTFAENNIDYFVLPDLTENDLEKLGVSSLGHRKKLLRAIEALTAARQPTGTTKSVSSATVGPPSLVQHREAEFRQITVMFCDLVGCTRWERRRISPHVYRPLPLPTRYSSRNRRGVSYGQLLIFRTSGSRNSKV